MRKPRASAIQAGDYRAAYLLDERIKVIHGHVTARVRLATRTG